VEGPEIHIFFQMILRGRFPTLVMFKIGASWFFSSPQCVNGTTDEGSFLTIGRRQLACLHLFCQFLENTVGFASSIFV
jgi:hypothetical protein